VISVPGGKARVATRTFGPVNAGTGAAAACGAEAPVNMLRAIKAVIAAMSNAATSNTTFFLSMTNCPLSDPVNETCYFM
jgi:hypothetical protein